MNSLYSQVNDNTPVLVGCSQYLDTKGPDGLNYLDILRVACEKAIKDCKARISLNEHLDTISVIRFVGDYPKQKLSYYGFMGLFKYATEFG